MAEVNTTESPAVNNQTNNPAQTNPQQTNSNSSAGNQTNSNIDYEQIDAIIQSRESGLLKSVLKTKGIDENELDSAIQAYKASKAAKAAEQQNAVNAQLKELEELRAYKAGQELNVQVAELAKDEEIGIPADRVSAALKLADTGKMKGKDGAYDATLIRNELKSVVTAYPFLKAAAQPTGFVPKVGANMAPDNKPLGFNFDFLNVAEPAKSKK